MNTNLKNTIAGICFVVGFMMLFTLYLIPLGLFLMWLADGGADKIERLFRMRHTALKH